MSRRQRGLVERLAVRGQAGPFGGDAGQPGLVWSYSKVSRG